MKRYHPRLLAAATLSLSCLVLLAPAMVIPAMGQPGSDTATPSQAAPSKTEGTEAAEELESGEEIQDEILAVEETSHTAGTDEADETNAADKANVADKDNVADGTEKEYILPKTVPSPRSVPSPRIASGSNAAQEVTAVLNAGYNVVIPVPVHGAKEALTSFFPAHPEYTTAFVMLEDSSRNRFPISYDLEQADTASPGFTLLSGTIEPPEGYEIASELQTVTAPIFFYDPASPCEMPVTTADPFLNPHFLLTEADTEDALTANRKLDKTVYFNMEGGYLWSARLDWDLDGISFGTPGTYQAIANPVLPDGVLLPDHILPLACDVYIQEDGVFTLGPPKPGRFYLTVPWTKQTPDLQLFRCFYAIGDGEWQEDTEGEILRFPRSDTQYICVYHRNFLPDTPYYIQLSYDGEESNILEIRINAGQLDYEFHTGDRDGGDREDQTPPDVNQTVPPSESSEPETTLPPETSGPEETSPTETLPPETHPEDTPPEETSPAETLPTETNPEEADPADPPATSHSSGGGWGISGRRDFSGNSYVASGPGHQTQAPPSLLAGSTKEVPAAAPISETAASATENGHRGFSSKKGTAVQNPGTDTAVEEDTADYVVLSGKRLKKYMELHPGQPFLITKHRIQLEIPVEDSVFSGLENQSLFRVELLSLPDDTILVSLSIDGVPVPLEDMPELTITMPRPVPEDDVPLQVTGPDGAVLAEVQTVDSSRITFTLNQAGTFQIQAVTSQVSLPEGQPVPEPLSDASPVPAPKTPDSPGQDRPAPLLTALAVLAVLLISSGLFCLRRFYRRPDSVDKKGGGTP